MYELDRKDQIRFDRYITRRRIPQNAVYDFTFEHRFAVYHAPMCNQNVYFAYDKRCGRSVRVCSRREGTFGIYDYRLLIPKLLYAIKYTGDRRYLRPYADSPESRIDLIFRSLLPRCGYQSSGAQLRLSRSFYRQLTSTWTVRCTDEPECLLACLTAALCARRPCLPGQNQLEPITVVTADRTVQTFLTETLFPLLTRLMQEAGLPASSLRILPAASPANPRYSPLRLYVEKSRPGTKAAAVRHLPVPAVCG